MEEAKATACWLLPRAGPACGRLPWVWDTVTTTVSSAGLWYGGGTVPGHERRPEPMNKPTDRQDDDGPVPVFGTWRAIYTAVVMSALAVMLLVALFSRWPY